MIDTLRGLKRVLEKKLGKWAYPLQFGLVGLSGMVPDFVSFATLLTFMPLGPARGLSIWLAMTWNFWLNRRLTFSYARKGPVIQQYTLFCGSCLAGALASWSSCLGLCLVNDWFAQNKMIAAAIGVLAGAAVNYLLSRHIVFLAPHRLRGKVDQSKEMANQGGPTLVTNG